METVDYATIEIPSMLQVRIFDGVFFREGMEPIHVRQEAPVDQWFGRFGLQGFKEIRSFVTEVLVSLLLHPGLVLFPVDRHRLGESLFLPLGRIFGVGGTRQVPSFSILVERRGHVLSVVLELVGDSVRPSVTVASVVAEALAGLTVAVSLRPFAQRSFRFGIPGVDYPWPFIIGITLVGFVGGSFGVASTFSPARLRKLARGVRSVVPWSRVRGRRFVVWPGYLSMYGIRGRDVRTRGAIGFGNIPAMGLFGGIRTGSVLAGISLVLVPD